MEINRPEMEPIGVEIQRLTLGQYLDGFKPKPIEQSWLNDFASLERRESAQNLLNLLGSVVQRKSELRGVEVFRDPYKKDDWGERQRRVIVRFQENYSGMRLVSVSRNLPADYRQGRVMPGMAVYYDGNSRRQNKKYSGWLIPLPDETLLETQLISGPRPMYEIATSGGSAPRSDIETALNMVGCYFQDAYRKAEAENPQKGMITRFLGWRATTG